MGKNNTKSRKLTVDKGGRPTKMTEDVVAKLDSIFKVGGDISEATSYAGIDRATYYRWVASDLGFATKMESAQHYADIVAKNVVVDSVVKEKNLDSAKWWLERRVFRDEKPQVAIQVNNYKDVISKLSDD